MSPEPCTHDFAFQATVYWGGSRLAGSDALERKYADRYYCRKCLWTTLQNERVVGNTYHKVVAGTLPK